jgi:hypothetical protein
MEKDMPLSNFKLNAIPDLQINGECRIEYTVELNKAHIPGLVADKMTEEVPLESNKANTFKTAATKYISTRITTLTEDKLPLDQYVEKYPQATVQIGIKITYPVVCDLKLKDNASKIAFSIDDRGNVNALSGIESVEPVRTASLRI